MSGGGKMNKAQRVCLLLVVVIFISGCGKDQTTSETVTPMPSGMSGTVRIRLNYAANLPSMIDRFAEAVIVPQGAGTDQAQGTATISDVGHTKGLPNQQTLKVTAQNLDPEMSYQTRVNIYDSSEKKVQLYKGVCSQGDCLVITQNNPTEVEMTMEPVANSEILYQYSVPDSIRQQCAIGPTSESCGQEKDRVYYDPNLNTCKRFTWTGCGEIQPFTSMPLCQQGCIK